MKPDAMSGPAALLVIDMQLCAFDGQLIPAIHEGRDLLEKVAGLIGAARQSEIPVIFVQHCAALDGPPYARGTPGWKIHPLIAPLSGEAIVYKSQSSGFEGTNLQRVLEDKGTCTVIACGIQSEHCVTNTSFSALELGFEVLVVEDAHGTVSTAEDTAPVIIERQNALLSERGVDVQATALILDRFAAS